MKEPLTIILLFTSFSCLGQVFIGDAADFVVPPQKGCHSYSIFRQRTYKDTGHVLHSSKKALIKRAELNNGLVKRIKEFDGSAVISVVEQFYKDTLLVKYTRKFSASKDKEIYCYKYNHTTNELVSVIGAEGGNLIFKMVKNHSGDTSITKTFSHYQDIVYSDTEYEYFSPDSLVQTKASFSDTQPGARFTIKIFAPKNVLREKIDSTKDQVSHTIYKYDSLGRLLESRSEDPFSKSLTEYRYENHDVLVSTYGMYGKNKKQIQREQLSRYNKDGLLISEKHVVYDKPEGLAANKLSEMSESKPSPGRVILKSYINSRLIKVQISYGEQRDRYEIIYQ